MTGTGSDFILLTTCEKGESLICNTCGLSVEEDCLGNSDTTVTCEDNQSCYIKTLGFPTFTLRKKGCLHNSECNVTDAGGSFFNSTFSYSRTCCTTDQCNGATSLHVLLPAVIGAALSLICNTCGLSVEEDCLGNSNTTVTCQGNQSCYIKTLGFSNFNLRRKGCLDTSECNSTNSAGALFNSTFTISRTCCTTDQCNGATSLHVLLPAVIGAALFNITGDFKLHTRGCLDSDLCGKTLTGSILGAGFTSSFTCCQTDLCNGAAAPQLPLAAVCCAAAMLATLWAR
ncbi:hypothetical protein N1851_021325 [Merluccius polli]|uniref:UPAR/Ly6 domain-containing protein n=1 Tax=Merluccius polli TaxID=89951 RepID=A0AA47MK52_MERPO|nr:hypothetical protein N1851_021325 [Merluccius polli]